MGRRPLSNKLMRQALNQSIAQAFAMDSKGRGDAFDNLMRSIKPKKAPVSKKPISISDQLNNFNSPRRALNQSMRRTYSQSPKDMGASLDAFMNRKMSKRSLKKADYWYNNAPSRNPASPTQRPLTDDEMAIINDPYEDYLASMADYKQGKKFDFSTLPKRKGGVNSSPTVNLPTGGVKPDRPQWVPPMRQMPGGRGRPRRHDLLARPTDEIYQDTMEMTYDGSRPNRRRIFPFKSQQVSQSSQSSWKPNGAMIGAMMGATRQPNTTGIMGSAAMKRMTKSSKSSSSSRIHPAQLAAMYDANKTWERKQKLDAARWEKLGNSPIMAIAEMIAETIPGSTKGGGPFGYIKGANLAWSKTPGSISGKQSATTKRLSKRQAGPKPNKYM